MRRSIRFLAVIIVTLSAGREATAQTQASYLQLTPTVKTVLYSPASGSTTARVAVGLHHCPSPCAFAFTPESFG